VDQGIAAVWAGLAGLGGAGIGGAAAAWGAWIGGKKTVEAAEKQAQRSAASEHHAWQRETRYKEYRAVLSITEEMARWAEPVSLSTALELSSRLREAINNVYVVGPPEASAAAGRLLMPVLDAFFVHVEATASGRSVPASTPITWDASRSSQMLITHAEFREALRVILERPPS
jgi:hypothetical protein